MSNAFSFMTDTATLAILIYKRSNIENQIQQIGGAYLMMS
ncbi:hypothetical protein PROPEN_00385 [Proteus penneri ATCC 35198]|nr:hypothetical protein PROPEN_00385 [Proteus penneri ATCC 35198]